MIARHATVLVLLALLPAAVAAQDAAPAPAPWVLVGTLTGAHPKAFIRLRDGEVRAVAVGQELTPGLLLAAVEPRVAIVRRQGKLERIAMHWKGAGRAVPMITRAPGSVPIEASAVIAPATQGVAPRDSALRGAVSMVLESPSMLQSVLATADLEPVKDGVRVGELPEHGAINHFGLGEGDVVRAVNQMPVRSVADLERLMLAPGNADGMTLAILRNGAPHTLAYDPRRGLEVSEDPP